MIKRMNVFPPKYRPYVKPTRRLSGLHLKWKKTIHPQIMLTPPCDLWLMKGRELQRRAAERSSAGLAALTSRQMEKCRRFLKNLTDPILRWEKLFKLCSGLLTCRFQPWCKIDFAPYFAPSQKRSGNDLGWFWDFLVGKTGKQGTIFRKKIYFGKNRETTWVFESGNCKPIGKNRETVWGEKF